MSAVLRSSYWSLLLTLALVAVGCVQEYIPDVITTGDQYLVVDGFINGSGVTTIHLSRTQNLANQAQFPSEIKASVRIEDQVGLPYHLQESALGVYTSASLALSTNQKYRIRIRTSSGREYASDYVGLKQTPPIDNLAGKPQPDGLQIVVSAHDDQKLTQYYRWEYEETWEFTSAFRSSLTYNGTRVVPRRENIYNCWRSEKSASVNTTSTVRLRQDAVRDYRLLFIPAADGRLRHKYSLLVRQYALSQPEFAYWEALKKNTETLGTLFDPLPSQLQGNVHCLTDPTEPVLGFVGAASLVEKRLFIDRTQLPNDWRTNLDGYEKCTELDTFPSERWKGLSLQDYFADPQERIPVNGTTLFYTSQSPQCVDCRLRGTNVKPSFWP